MLDIKSQWNQVTDKGAWSARGGAFMAKLKATKAVWFPPQPASAGKKATSTAKKTGTRAGRKTTAAAKKSGGAAKKTTARSTGAAKKATNATSR
jgi:hypothetical protein